MSLIVMVCHFYKTILIMSCLMMCKNLTRKSEQRRLNYLSFESWLFFCTDGSSKKSEGNNGPDGMDFDADDNLIVTNQRAGSLEVFSPAGGSPITSVTCPFFRPSNVHFKPGTSTLYVTEHEFHGLWKFNWKQIGKKQYCDL